MTRSLVVIAAAAVLSASYGAAEQAQTTASSHVVSTEAAQARLLQTADQRELNLATVDAFVASPGGSAALAALGVNADRVRASLATLNDDELQDLASRAAALDADPVAAGFSKSQVIWIALIALAVVIVVAVVS